MAKTNSMGGHSIKNTGQEKTSPGPSTRSGSNSNRVSGGTAPQAVSGGTTKTPD